MGFIIIRHLSLYFLLIQARKSIQDCVESVIANNEYFTACNCHITTVLALACYDIGPNEHMRWDVAYTFCLNCEYPKRIEIIRWNKENIDKYSLQNLPAKFQYLVLSLSITSSEISNINSETFSKYTGLRQLHLDRNRLSTLGRGVFSEQSALEYLDLSYNNLESIADGLFLTDKNIKTLKLNNNKINYIHENSFYNLQNIEKINLGNNNISGITSLIFRRQNFLSYLDLSGNCITTLEQNSFENLTHLAEIYLQNNQLTSIPQWLLRKQKYLKIVNLSNNPIITYLLLNQFIGNLGSLETLNLGNTFHSDLILENVNSTENLSFLSMNNNNLSKISNYTFAIPRHLEFIDLSFNQIKYVEVGAFGQLLNLTTLKLNNNNIQTLLYGTFLFLDELSELDLSFNKIRSFPLGLLDPCYKLHILRLSHNRLHYLSKLNFELFNKLETLEIDNNALTHLDGISSLPNLKEISIENNNWDCLELRHFIDKLEEKSVQIRQVPLDPGMDHHIRHISCENKKINVDLDRTKTMKPFREDYYEKYIENMTLLLDKFSRSMNGIINEGSFISELNDKQDHFENITKILMLPDSHTESKNNNIVVNYIFLFISLNLLIIVGVCVLFIIYKLRKKNVKEYILSGLPNPIL